MHAPIFSKSTLNPTQTLELVVPPGSSAIVVGRKLHELGASTGPELFSLASRIAGVHKSLKAGVYSLSPKTSLASILARISAGDSLHASITLIEGWTFEQVITEIHKHPHIKKSLSTIVNKRLIDFLKPKLLRFIDLTDTDLIMFCNSS